MQCPECERELETVAVLEHELFSSMEWLVICKNSPGHNGDYNVMGTFYTPIFEETNIYNGEIPND